MNRPILLRHLSNSSLQGQARQFSTPRIRLGRKSDNDVIFDPEQDRLVSGYHCEIIAQGDALFVVDPGSTNGTYVNGRRVQGRMPVSDRDQITLGESGPTFAVSFAGGGLSNPMTIMASAPQVGLSQAGAQGLMNYDSAGGVGVASPPRQAYSLEAPPGIPPQHSPPPVPSLQPPAVAHQTHRPPSRTSQGLLPKQGVGINTLMAELNKATQRERKRLVVLAVPGVAILVLIVGLIWFFTRGGEKPGTVIVNNVPATTTAAQADWSKVLAERKTSIYLMLMKVPDKEPIPFGTAWAVGKGILATNAHVAAEFYDVPPTVSIIARSDTTPPVDLKIESVVIHPGYTEWKRCLNAYAPLDSNTGKRIGYPMTFDAAIMKVAAADIDKQGKPLELADAKTLASLTEASEVASMGYPMEGSAEGGVNARSPEPHRFIGIISRKTDIFLSAANEARSNFLQYTIQVQGGSSGSPVFNHDGKVIGLVAGNDVVGEGNEGARIMISGKSFGPRADAIRELLDNQAEAKLQPVAKEWRATLKEKWDKAFEAKKYDVFPDVRATVSYNIVRQSKLAKREQWTGKPITRLDKIPVTSADLTAANGSKTFTYTADDAGYYVIVVGTSNPHVTPKVTLPDVEPFIRAKPKDELGKILDTLGEGTPFAACHPVRKAQGETIQFVVSSVANQPGETATFTATVYRAPLQ